MRERDFLCGVSFAFLSTVNHNFCAKLLACRPGASRPHFAKYSVHLGPADAVAKSDVRALPRDSAAPSTPSSFSAFACADHAYATASGRHRSECRG